MRPVARPGRIVLALAAGLGAGACVQAPPPAAGPGGDLRFQVARDPLPDAVVRSLPPGLARQDLLVGVRPGEESFCFYYRQGGRILPLSTDELRAAGFPPDQPHCVG